MQVSTADLAGILGVTERRVQQLENLGVFAKLEHGEWGLAEAVQAYVRHRLKAKPKPAAVGKAEERLKSVKAEREQLKLEVEQRALIPTTEAIAIIDTAIGTLRSGLGGVAARITREMQLRGKIEAEIDAALGAAADKFDKWRSAFDPAVADDAAAAEDDAGSLGSDEP